MEGLFRIFRRKMRIIQLSYVVCLLFCVSCANNVIKYDCETHSIYSEDGYKISHLYFEDSMVVHSLYKKNNVNTERIYVYRIYDYFDIDSNSHSDTIRIIPNMKYIITNQSSMDATGYSITLYTDSVGNIICPY